MSRVFLLLVALFSSLPAVAQLSLGGNSQGLLEPEKAFRFSARPLDDRSLEVRFAIADGYYMYRERFRFSASGDARLGPAQFPPGKKHKDEFFGETETYRKEVRIVVPAQAQGPFELAVVSQGCADVGVCYIPMESKARIVLAAAGGPAPSLPVDEKPNISLFASDIDIARLFQGNFALVLASFLGFGLLLAFTPCMLPMIPILSSVIVGAEGRMSRSRGFLLSATYVMGMAVTYAGIGIAAGYVGSALAAYLQNTWVLVGLAVLFVVLALSMFGLYELQLPHGLVQRLHSLQSGLPGGQFGSVAVMGMLSAIIVSPCVSAPLAGALLEISRTGDVALGGGALFAMAVGMGIPLLVIGVSGGALLPKAGPWMNRVKQFFGVLLIGVALWIVWPILAPGGSAAGFTRVDSIAQLEERLRNPGRPVMLDFYADWCVSCKEMEKFTFTDARVREKMGRMLLLQADVTDNTPEHRALLKRFSLFGPPGIVFFDAQGREIQGLRVIGYQNADRFLKTLELLER